MLNLSLITSSLVLILSLLIVYFSIGYTFRTIVKKITKKDISFTIFKTILYGLLIVVFFYVLIKSPYILNSISITFVPVLIFFYERSKLVKAESQAVNYKNLTKYFLFGFFAFFIFYLAKYLFHFSSQINTGYSDQAFYHTIASSLKFTGIETINIHTGGLKLIPGMIYHYWDLWFLAFHYDLLIILNQFGLFESFNQFEINVLVFQPSLFLILFIGFIETSFKISVEFLKRVKYKASILILSSLLVLCHSFLEFGIIHHPKQFFIAAIFILFVMEILDIKKISVNFFYFYPFLIFYYPLPGSILMATCLIFSSNWENIRANFRSKKLYSHLAFIVFTFILFFYYYFIYAQTCIPQLYNHSKPAWRILTAVNKIFIFHGYHNLISPLGVFVSINLIFILLIHKKRILSGIISVTIINYVLTFSILNILLGHLVSAIFYNVPEEFQLYNNDYFSLSLILLFDVLLVFYYLRGKVFFAFLICIFSFLYFLVITFYDKPLFYKGVSIEYSDYIKLKSKRFDKHLRVQIEDNIDELISFSDITLSFYNSYPKHKKNICDK
jgi:hypothetical protein